MADSSSSAQPQSMEAILASIKRIIQEPTGHAPVAVVPVEMPPTAAAPEEDTLELGWPSGSVLAPLTDARPAAVLPIEEDPGEASSLVSVRTLEASARAMAALSTVSIDPHAPPNTIDGLVREMLRPMLKEWLNANLPDLVERVVAREIARLGGR